MALVLALTAASGSLGPSLSGLLAPFPIITGVLAVFTHGHYGAGQARVLLRNFLVGFYGFATFCFTLAIALRPLGTGAGFLVATAVAVLTQCVVFAGRSLLVGWHETTPHAPEGGRVEDFVLRAGAAGAGSPRDRP